MKRRIEKNGKLTRKSLHKNVFYGQQSRVLIPKGGEIRIVGDGVPVWRSRYAASKKKHPRPGEKKRGRYEGAGLLVATKPLSIGLKMNIGHPHRSREKRISSNGSFLFFFSRAVAGA